MIDMGYELYHHGILGMKWGVRRFQNKDGSLTSAGKKRYGLNKEIHDAEKRDRNKYADSKDLRKRQGADYAVKESIMRPSRIADDIARSSGTKLLNDDDRKEVKRLNDKIDDYSQATWDSASRELDKASSDPEFKKELEQYLYNELGNGCDDKEYFDLTVVDGVANTFYANKKYYPETLENDRKLKSSVDELFGLTDKKVNAYISEFGDEPLTKFAGDTAKYSDVVKNLVEGEAGSHMASYLYKNNLESAIIELTYVGTDPNDYYTFDEYNKKFGGK